MINESTMVAEGYARRAEINKSNGSLTLLEVKQSDAGNYFANVSSCKKRWQEVFELKVEGKNIFRLALSLLHHYLDLLQFFAIFSHVSRSERWL